ncbi:MAG: SHOCT domain-containing protein [Neisseria sp.]|nr:SHOCT domain-containing protein [Neisseria sp.]
MTEKSLSEQLRELAQLHQDGVLNDAEFQAAKARLLGRQGGEPATPTPQQTPQHAAQVQQPVVVHQKPTLPAQTAQNYTQPERKTSAGAALVAVGVIACLLVGGAFYLMKTSTQQFEKNTQTASEASVALETPASTPEELQQQELAAEQAIELEGRLTQARLDFEAADKNVSRVWTDMNPDVRKQLKKEQIAWNRSKDSTCRQAALDAGDDGQMQELARLECLTKWNNDRVPELVVKEQEMLPKVLEQTLDDAENVFTQARQDLGEIARRIPDDVLSRVIGDWEGWMQNAIAECENSVDSSLSEQEQSVQVLKCSAKVLREKAKELKDYAI